MRNRMSCAAVAAAVALGAAGAEAQEAAGGMMMDRRISQFDLGLYVGGSLTSPWFDSRTATTRAGVLTENDDEQAYGPGYAPIAGLTGTFWATPMFGVRAHGAYAPMRLPFATDNAFDGFGDAATERDSYVVNTYLYDLSLVARPFVMNDARWLNGVYLWAGGGGVTANVGGDTGCEPGTVALQACLPRDWENATVGQGTAGAGMTLLPLSSSLGLFGELGFHVYDSPVHVGDGWLGVQQVPAGGTIRIADDRTAVTGRLVLGLKLMLGNQMEMAPMVAPAPMPMPEPMPMPAPVDEMRNVEVCVVENGMLRNVQAQYNATRGDTMVNGQAFSMAYPATTGYAAGASWFINSEALTINGQQYVRFGLPRVLGVTDVARMTDYQGVPVFAETGATGTPDIVYVAVRPGCEFQPYQREQKVRNVRG